MTIKYDLNNYALEIDNLLNDLINIPGTSEAKLYEAMLYSLIGGGKKLRAFGDVVKKFSSTTEESVRGVRGRCQPVDVQRGAAWC